MANIHLNKALEFHPDQLHRVALHFTRQHWWGLGKKEKG